MGTNKPKTFKVRSLYISASIVALASSMPAVADAAPAKPSKAKRELHAPETFRATINDGTEEVIKASAHADAPTVLEKEEFLEDMAATSETNSTSIGSSAANIASPEEEPSAEQIELANLKRQNKELQNRLKHLEEVKAEKKIGEQTQTPSLPPIAPAPAPAELSAYSSVSSPEDDGVELSSDELMGEATVGADPATPTDLLEERLREKRAVSKQARAQAAKAQAALEKKGQLRSQAAKFDAVPERHIPDLAKRLKYANEILKRFGRAYDYRLMTLSQFRKVLAELEAQEEKSAELN